MTGQTGKAHTYVAIDAKSFYASVEAVDRHYDPLTVNLVVADLTRTDKTICLAVSPALKAYGISGRARLFEVVEAVRQINAARLQKAIRLGVAKTDPETGEMKLGPPSFDSLALASDPSLELSYVVAPPRMLLYEKVSTKIFSIYSRFISPEDIHVYSIDEVFLDVTRYLAAQKLTAEELTMRMIREVLHETGITATAGIGTNLYLAKIAMDIVAKHVEPDAQGVRLASLDEQSYRETLWCHTPLTDFWRVGGGTARRLAGLGCFTMGDVARLSVRDESLLYRALGINAELLIDHAWGWEPATMQSIRAYRPENRSLSSGQVLSEPYDTDSGRLIVREMTELLVLDLVRQGVMTRQVTLTVGYDRSSIVASRPENGAEPVYLAAKTGERYAGVVGTDWYGRPCPKHAHGTGNLDHWTSSTRLIMDAMMQLYDRIVDPDLSIRRVNIVACNILPEAEVPAEAPEQLDLFTDFDALEREREAQRTAEERERRIQRTALNIQARYGKNALLKGMNLLEGGTTIERNMQVGGHRSGAAATASGRNKPKKLSEAAESAEQPEAEGRVNAPSSGNVASPARDAATLPLKNRGDTT